MDPKDNISSSNEFDQLINEIDIENKEAVKVLIVKLNQYLTKQLDCIVRLHDKLAKDEAKIIYLTEKVEQLTQENKLLAIPDVIEKKILLFNKLSTKKAFFVGLTLGKK